MAWTHRLVCSHVTNFPDSVRDPVRTLTVDIAARPGEALERSTHYQVLFFTGGLLFLIRFVVNLDADMVIYGGHRR